VHDFVARQLRISQIARRDIIDRTKEALETLICIARRRHAAVRRGRERFPRALEGSRRFLFDAIREDAPITNARDAVPPQREDGVVCGRWRDQAPPPIYLKVHITIRVRGQIGFVGELRFIY
jgi:hypothetical protein